MTSFISQEKKITVKFEAQQFQDFCFNVKKGKNKKNRSRDNNKNNGMDIRVKKKITVATIGKIKEIEGIRTNTALIEVLLKAYFEKTVLENEKEKKRA